MPVSYHIKIKPNFWDSPAGMILGGFLLLGIMGVFAVAVYFILVALPTWSYDGREAAAVVQDQSGNRLLVRCRDQRPQMVFQTRHRPPATAPEFSIRFDTGDAQAFDWEYSPVFGHMAAPQDVPGLLERTLRAKTVQISVSFQSPVLFSTTGFAEAYKHLPSTCQTKN